MIEEEKYKDLINLAIAKNWGYQGKERFRDYFFPFISKYFKVFENSLNVLDIGCCSGIISLAISEYSRKCTGIEYNSNFASHFNYIKERYEANIDIFNTDIESFIKINSKDIEFDALFASNILYHLDNNTISLLKEKVLPRCEKVLLFSRENKPKLKNNYGLHKWENVSDLLKSSGFEVKRLDTVKNVHTDYTTSYEKVNRKVEMTHTDSVLIPIYGYRKNKE